MCACVCVWCKCGVLHVYVYPCLMYFCGHFPFSSIEGALICLQPYPESDTFPDLIPMFRSLGVGGGCGSRNLDTNHLLLGALS